MAVGLATVPLANKWLDTPHTAGGAAFGPVATYIKLHTADPGGTAVTAPSANVTRVVATLGNASGGAIAITGTNPVWTNGGTGETLSHISVWDAITAGNLLWTAAITTPQAWASGNTFTLTSLGMSLAPLAA